MAQFTLTVYRNRTVANTVTLYQADGTTGVALVSGDKVRLKAYRRNGATPVLDMVSGAALSGGSSITITSLTSPATATVTFDQDDTTSLDPGTYSCEILVMDSADGSRIKHAQQGILYLLPAGAGGVT